MPSPFEAVLLGLAAWRVWHLLAKDDLTAPLRRYVTANREPTWDDFIECPYCLGAWVAGAWVVAFAVWPEVIWGALVFAVAAVPPLVNNWMKDDD